MKESKLNSDLQAEHGKLKEQITSFAMITDELEEMEQARSAGEWVGDKMGESKEALVQLEKMLAALERGLIIHWQMENEELMPFLKDSGQTDFAATLASEHREIALRLKQFRNKARELAQGRISAQELSTQVSQLRHELKAFLETIEEHAAREEQMLFQIGHGV